jgi:nucleoside-diphosphate-sugar epimerase
MPILAASPAVRVQGTMKILITGGTGFVGAGLISRLLADGASPLAAVRGKPNFSLLRCPVVTFGNIDGSTNWIDAFTGVSCVVHLAARVHVMRESADDPLAEFRRVNTEGTLNLARQVAEAGVRRFIFLSTIGVNGNSTLHGKVFTPIDTPSPHDPYSLSKYEAEIGLRSIAQSTGMEVVIIRPPLVYGTNAPGNFGKLTRLIAKSLPLPFGSINNLRSFVGIDNLVDFIVMCLERHAAANETFMVSDGEDLSTPDLIRRVARAMNRPARLFSVPPGLLAITAALLGKSDLVRRLCGSLQVDISKSHDLLGWKPRVSVDEGLRRAVGGI